MVINNTPLNPLFLEGTLKTILCYTNYIFRWILIPSNKRGLGDVSRNQIDTLRFFSIVSASLL